MSAKKHSLGIVGRKAGMSRMFTEDGKSVPVTLIEATPNRIAQIRQPVPVQASGGPYLADHPGPSGQRGGDDVARNSVCRLVKGPQRGKGR